MLPKHVLLKRCGHETFRFKSLPYSDASAMRLLMSDKITRFLIASALKQTVLQIITSAVYSISIKSIFARAVIGSQGVVTNGIITAAVCCAGTLVYI